MMPVWLKSDIGSARDPEILTVSVRFSGDCSENILWPVLFPTMIVFIRV